MHFWGEAELDYYYCQRPAYKVNTTNPPKFPKKNLDFSWRHFSAIYNSQPEYDKDNCSQKQNDQTRNCIVDMMKLLVLFCEGWEDKADDVDETGDNADDDVGLAGFEVDDGPAPGDSDQHCCDYCFCQIF